ncbi:hypothetical protein [Streptomyces nodosus]|uniref:hypothetical protein n=1 Tax=Streptomyces nodosus TaxID=40318 RepID=UPI00381E8604
MSDRIRFVASVAGVLLLGGTSPALAADFPDDVAEPLVAEGAPVVPGTVTSHPTNNPEALEGVDVTGELEEDAPLPGETEIDLAPEPIIPDKLRDTDAYPDGDYCGPPTNFVKITKNTKNTMAIKYSTFVQNNTSTTKEFRFTSKKSGTTTIGASVTIGSEFKTLWLAKIKVDVQASAQKSWTSELGIETSGKVKAHSTVYGDYGIKKENVYGYTATLYSNCQVGNVTYMDVHAPYREGWVVS